MDAWRRNSRTRIAAILAAGALAACSSQPAPSQTPARTAPAQAAGRTTVGGTAPRGAIITLEPAVPREFPPPADSLLMDQFGLAFLPDSLVGRVGQRIDFRSSEDVQHNVRVVNTATKDTVFNVATPPFETYTHTFDTPGDYAVSCDVHPSMRAGIYIASTPYVTVAGKDGSFEFADVEPGSYKLVALDGERRLERAIDVTGPRTDVALDGR